MKLRKFAIPFLLVGTIVLLFSCDVSISNNALADGASYNYTGLYNSSGVVEIDIDNSAMGIDILSAYLVDTGTDITYGGDLLGPYTIGAGNVNYLFGAPATNNVDLQLRFADSTDNAYYGPLNTAIYNYEILVRIDSAAWNLLYATTTSPDTKIFKTNGLIVTVKEKPRQ